MAEITSIKFYRGSKAGLNTIISGSGIEVGKPYFTTDNGKEELYVGTGVNTVALIGKVLVGAVGDMPAAGESGRAYMATDENYKLYIDDGSAWRASGITNIDDLSDGTNYARVAAAFVDASGRVTQIGDGTNTVTASQARGHIDDTTTNPHAVDIADAVTQGNDVGGTIITGLPAPTSDNDAARKKYVDDEIDSAIAGLAGGIEWQDSALDIVLDPTSLSPSAGDRYLINGTGAGDWAGHDNEIAEWSGSAWTYTSPTTGMGIGVDDETDRVYVYSGSVWVAKYWENTTAGNGNEKVGTAIGVKADTTGGVNLATAVNVSANGVAIKVDDTSIEENGSGQLAVKEIDGGTWT